MFALPLARTPSRIGHLDRSTGRKSESGFRSQLPVVCAMISNTIHESRPVVRAMRPITITITIAV